MDKKMISSENIVRGEWTNCFNTLQTKCNFILINILVFTN